MFTFLFGLILGIVFSLIGFGIFLFLFLDRPDSTGKTTLQRQISNPYAEIQTQSPNERAQKLFEDPKVFKTKNFNFSIH